MSDDDVRLERRSNDLDIGWCRLTRTGLQLTPGRQPSMEEWTSLGEKLAMLEGGIAWLVGDWLNMGEATFGEMAAQVIDHEEWAEETVRVYRWVCAKVPRENRSMSFAHCQAVAGLPPVEQRQWLAKASGDGGTEPWSSGRLKSEIASSQPNAETKMEYLCTVAFDSPAPREQLAQEYERVGRPVTRTERARRPKKSE